MHWEATLKVHALLCSPITEPSSYHLHIEWQPPQGLFFIENAFYQLSTGSACCLSPLLSLGAKPPPSSATASQPPYWNSSTCLSGRMVGFQSS